VRDVYAQWLHEVEIGLLVVGVLALPRAHRRLGRRWMAVATALVTVGAVAWTVGRYGDPVLGWRTLVLVAAGLVLYAFSASYVDHSATARPQPPAG
jgi:hypothetical protein